MKKTFIGVLFAIVQCLVAGSAFAQFEFGTKFACCTIESASCLGSGTSTSYNRTLRDRALTQVDAQARCGFSRMYWNTHSCPADVPCSGSDQPIYRDSYSYSGNGGGRVYRDTSSSDQNAWVEHRNSGVKSYFVKFSEDNDFTYLHDRSRNIDVALGNGEWHWRNSGESTWHSLGSGRWTQ